MNLTTDKIQRIDRSTFYSVNDIIAVTDPLYELKLESLFYVAYLTQHKNPNLLGEIEFTLNEFALYTQRKKSALFLSSSKKLEDTYGEMTFFEHQIKSQLEVALIELSQKAIQTQQMFQRGNQDVVSFGVTSLFTFNIALGKTGRKDSRTYSLKINPAFIDGVLSQYMAIMPQRWFALRGNPMQNNYPLMQRLGTFNNKVSAGKNSHETFQLYYSEVTKLTGIKINTGSAKTSASKTITKINSRLEKIQKEKLFNFEFSIDSKLNYNFIFYKSILFIENDEQIKIIRNFLASVVTFLCEKHEIKNLRELNQHDIQDNQEQIKLVLSEFESITLSVIKKQ